MGSASAVLFALLLFALLALLADAGEQAKQKPEAQAETPLADAKAPAVAAVAGAAAGGGLFSLVTGLANALVPTAMWAFGAVVPGVGTLHAAGGMTAGLQVVGTATLSSPVGVAAVIGGVGAASAVECAFPGTTEQWFGPLAHAAASFWSNLTSS
jgi:hypothetical protein